MARQRTKTADTPAPPETELVVANADVETEPDGTLVTEAVAEIRQILTDTLYRGATAVGEYVLEKFFDGDPAQVHSRHPRKGASFRAFTERCESQDLPIKRSWLHSAVGVAVMNRQLADGGTAFKQLPPALQTTLLPLKKPSEIERVAQQAVTKNLSLRELRQVVKDKREKDRDPDETRGRRPKPQLVKALDAATKVLRIRDDGRLDTKALMDEIADDDVGAVVRTAGFLIAKLQGLVDKIEERKAAE